MIRTPSKPVMHPSTFYITERVQMHPATDAWMRGDRYGEVIKLGTKNAHVLMDVSGRTITVHYDNLQHLPGCA